MFIVFGIHTANVVQLARRIAKAELCLAAYPYTRQTMSLMQGITMSDKTKIDSNNDKTPPTMLMRATSEGIHSSINLGYFELNDIP